MLTDLGLGDCRIPDEMLTEEGRVEVAKRQLATQGRYDPV